MTPSLLVILIVLLFPLAFGGMWCGVLLLLSRLSGWHRLAQHFASDRLPDGTRFQWQSGYLGLISYRHCLNITVAANGLHLAVSLPFRIGHPNLLIPWQAIGPRSDERFFWHSLSRMEIGRPALATLKLPASVMDARRT